jgi:hypothetical protein
LCLRLLPSLHLLLACVRATADTVFPVPSPSFCIEVSRTLVELGVPFLYFRLGQLDGGGAVSARGREARQLGSVPNAGTPRQGQPTAQSFAPLPH